MSLNAARLDPIGPLSLATDALSRLRRAPLQVLIFAVLTLGITPLLDQFPIELQLGLVLPHEVTAARKALRAVMQCLVGAALLRALVAEPAAARSARGNLAAGIAVLLLLAAPRVATDVVAGLVLATNSTMSVSMVLAIGAVLDAIAAYFAMRLFLWPIGRLVGWGEMTPGRSWALTRGTVRSYIVVIVVLYVIYLTVTTVVPLRLDTYGFGAFLELQRTVIAPVQDLLIALIGLAMSAAIFARRLGRRSNVAEVFD